jgi:hypothetical protein
MDIQFVEMLQKCSKGSALSHLRDSIYILRETLAAISELTIRTRDIGVGVIDISGKK